MARSFAQKVYLACAKIPKGRVSTYLALARRINSPKSARAVGNALNKNTDTVRVPCHRVVRSDGFVGGYAFGSKKKIARLKREGVRVSASGFIDLKKFGFE